MSGNVWEPVRFGEPGEHRGTWEKNRERGVTEGTTKNCRNAESVHTLAEQRAMRPDASNINANLEVYGRVNLCAPSTLLQRCEGRSDQRATEIVNGTDQEIVEILRSTFLEVTNDRAWSESQEANQDYVEGFIRQFSSDWRLRGFTADLGIFTSQEDETMILGRTWQPFGLNLSLWYSRLDGKEVSFCRLICGVCVHPS